MDQMINQALDYLDQFDRPNGLLIHVNWGPMKKRGSNLILDRQDIFKIGPKFEIKYAGFFGNPNQSLIGSDWIYNQAHKHRIVATALHLRTAYGAHSFQKVSHPNLPRRSAHETLFVLIF